MHLSAPTESSWFCTFAMQTHLPLVPWRHLMEVVISVVFFSVSAQYVLPQSRRTYYWELPPCTGRKLLGSIAALVSKRINLSPFTKGCRDAGASMRLYYNFFFGALAPILPEYSSGKNKQLILLFLYPIIVRNTRQYYGTVSSLL